MIFNALQDHRRPAVPLIRNENLKLHLLRHGLAVLISEVAIGLHGKGSAVLVAEPSGYRRDINA